jgi:hypothetical protein
MNDVIANLWRKFVMLTPAEIWPMIAASAVVVFGAGGMAARIRNGKHVTKEFCNKQHELTNERFNTIIRGQAEIKGMVHEIKAWINKDGIA